MDQRTDRPTDRPTDRSTNRPTDTHRDGWTHLRQRQTIVFTVFRYSFSPIAIILHQLVVRNRDSLCTWDLTLKSIHLLIWATLESIGLTDYKFHEVVLKLNTFLLKSCFFYTQMFISKPSSRNITAETTVTLYVFMTLYPLPLLQKTEPVRHVGCDLAIASGVKRSTRFAISSKGPRLRLFFIHSPRSTWHYPKYKPVAPGHQMDSSSLALLLIHPLLLIFLVIFVAAGQRPR